jgi:uncharacterized protein
MKRTLSILALATMAVAANAQVMLTSVGQTYSQNFDTLAATGTNVTWDDNVTLQGWYMRRYDDINGVLANVYTANAGASTTGTAYSYGTGTSTDRALGSIASGSVEHLIYGVRIRNNTGSTLASFSLSYFGEQWRNGGNTTPQSLWFSYRVGGTDVGQDLQPTGGEAGYTHDPSFTRVASLDFTSPIATASGGGLDGNFSEHRVGISGTVNIAGGWANGQDLWIRWVDVNNVGNDHGLAIDDLNLTVQAVPEPGTMAALGLGIAAIAARRRRNRG